MARVVAGGMLVVCLALPGLAAGDEARPIPQDKKRHAARARTLYEFLRHESVDAFKQVGKKDPKWTKLIPLAMDAVAQTAAGAREVPFSRDDLFEAFRRPIKLGCDDGLVLYMHARFSVGKNDPGLQEHRRRMAAAVKALDESRYNHLRKAAAHYRLGQLLLSSADGVPPEPDEAKQHFDAALALLEPSVRDDERGLGWDLFWTETLVAITAGYQSILSSEQEAFDAVDTVVARVPDLNWLRLQLKGDHLIRSGWEARGTGFAGAVTEDGAKTFRTRLTGAREALEQSWKLQPDNPRTATLMIIVEKGIGDGDREAMETWFRRAMEADMNNREACGAKLDWLDPKWHGSPDDLLAFGRACRDTGNWQTGITLYLSDAHHRVAALLPPLERRKYMHSPEVWDDIRGVYEQFLHKSRDPGAIHCTYAVFAVLCGQFDVGREHFRLAGDPLPPTGIFSSALANECREYVESGPGAAEKPER